MDENTKRMMERLKADPAALRRLMQSRDGQTLMQALTRPDNGVGLQRAVQEIDPDAFVIVCDAHEILGEGFGVYAPGGL